MSEVKDDLLFKKAKVSKAELDKLWPWYVDASGSDGGDEGGGGGPKRSHLGEVSADKLHKQLDQRKVDPKKFVGYFNQQRTSADGFKEGALVRSSKESGKLKKAAQKAGNNRSAKSATKVGTFSKTSTAASASASSTSSTSFANKQASSNRETDVSAALISAKRGGVGRVAGAISTVVTDNSLGLSKINHGSSSAGGADSKQPSKQIPTKSR